MRNLFGLVICICFGLALSGTYHWNNGAGGSWSDASNWSPNDRVPGPNDDVIISGDSSTVQNAQITLGGGVASVNSLRLDQREYNYYTLTKGAITVASDFYMSGGLLYKVNLTLNGDSKISCGRDDDVCTCDGCKVKVSNALTFTYEFFSAFRKNNNAEFTNLQGATTTIEYNSVYFEGNNGQAKGTLINYGNLIFKAAMLASPHTPYGDAQAANTGSWQEIRNYGLVEIQTPAYEVGLPLYSDVLMWGHFAGAKMNMRIYQPSTLTNSLFYNPDYEYNDHIATASRTDVYNCTLGGDLHVVFGSIEVEIGQQDRPFDPKIGNFFPIFVNNICSGKWGAITFEGLPSGMALGPLVNASSENELVHYGVVICASTDTFCIQGGGWDYPIPDHRVPFQGGGSTPDGTNPDSPSGSNPDSPSGSNPSDPNSPSGSNPNSPSRSNPSNSPSSNIKNVSIATSTTLASIFFVVMTLVSVML